MLFVESELAVLLKIVHVKLMPRSIKKKKANAWFISIFNKCLKVWFIKAWRA